MAEKEDKTYSGCLKSIDKARDYARQHFVYGLSTKEELLKEYEADSVPGFSMHSIENSFRNMGNWFRECLRTRTVSVDNTKQIRYISANCRDYSANPIYKMWKASSFTTNDIVFFFFLLDYLSDGEGKKLSTIYDAYSEKFCKWSVFGQDSARKWMTNKGIPSGIIKKKMMTSYIIWNPIVHLWKIKIVCFISRK
jgi:hypothetical protein